MTSRTRGQTDPPLKVSHLYLALVQEHVILNEAAGFLPTTLQSVQVEEVGGAVVQVETNPRTPVVP